MYFLGVVFVSDILSYIVGYGGDGGAIVIYRGLLGDCGDGGGDRVCGFGGDGVTGLSFRGLFGGCGDDGDGAIFFDIMDGGVSSGSSGCGDGRGAAGDGGGGWGGGGGGDVLM